MSTRDKNPARMKEGDAGPSTPTAFNPYEICSSLIFTKGEGSRERKSYVSKRGRFIYSTRFVVGLEGHLVKESTL